MLLASQKYTNLYSPEKNLGVWWCVVDSQKQVSDRFTQCLLSIQVGKVKHVPKVWWSKSMVSIGFLVYVFHVDIFFLCFFVVFICFHCVFLVYSFLTNPFCFRVCSRSPSRSLNLGGESAGFDTGRSLLDEWLGPWPMEVASSYHQLSKNGWFWYILIINKNTKN